MVLAPISFVGFVVVMGASGTEWARYLLLRIHVTL
jgi:hypothetical protein